MDKPVVNNPDLCIIHTRSGERIGPQLAAMLDPIDPATFHEYVLAPNTHVELHSHDMDEYWCFTSGSPIVTLWTPTSGRKEYQLQPGDLVACVRGVGHTLKADHALVYFQFESVPRQGARRGHLPVVEEPTEDDS